MKKILVANRSEIACRVFQACREMGLKSVGIAAPGDEEARHLTYADEVQDVSSYLDISSIIQAAQRSGAHLIHPGYGFLSERPAFVRAVEKAGLTFIGPRADTMELIGGKISAKELAGREKVPTVPWALVTPYSGSKDGDLKAAARTVGFPLLMKASAGGGGKGMRRVDRAEDLPAAAESAAAEALSAFGDGTLFLERLVEKPRHIEVQIFGDGQGNSRKNNQKSKMSGGIHLHERECTLQRRHQKIWEEATAPNLSSKTRENLFESALKMLRATHYRNAGTVEFLVDANEDFYFLEINARLQVEHPVTELVTGVDLVHAQIAQALNTDEPVFKESPSTRGHAIEVRLYAEDPAQGFIPTPGRIDRLHWPTGSGIRIESGIEEGQQIGTQFDSLLGKLIVYAENRTAAIHRLRFALEETVVLGSGGLGTNQNYLRALTFHPMVLAGTVDTEFLQREMSYGGEWPTADELSLLFSCGSHMNSVANPMSNDIKSPWNAFYKTGGSV